MLTCMMLSRGKIYSSPSFRIKKSLWIRSRLYDYSADEVVSQIHECAKQGHAWAQFDLGYLHTAGQWVSQDDIQAYAWFRIAAMHADIEAKELVHLLSENMTPSQLAEAKKLSRELCEPLDSVCETENKSSSKTCMAYERQAVEQGPEAQFRLGFRYYKGRGVPLDHDKAVYWFYRAAELGDARAQFVLGVMFTQGKGTFKDGTKAEYWYHKAAEQGIAGAQYNLDVLHSKGEKASEDQIKYVNELQMTAEQGDAKSHSILGVMYARGEWIHDAGNEMHWYPKADERLRLRAQISQAISGNKEICRIDVNVVYWYRKAVEREVAKLHSALGIRHTNGEGILKFGSEEVHRIRQAAEQGNARAQFVFGIKCAIGIFSDKALAEHWLRKAAEQGHPEAQGKFSFLDTNVDKVFTEDEMHANASTGIAAAQETEPDKNAKQKITKRKTHVEKPKLGLVQKVLKNIAPWLKESDRSTHSESYLISLRHQSALWLAPAALLVIALLPWPYGFYIFLKLFIFAVCLVLTYTQWKHDNAISGWVLAFGAMAILYNPLFRIYLTREIWSVLNIATALLFVGHLRALRRLVTEPTFESSDSKQKLSRSSFSLVKRGLSLIMRLRNTRSSAD